MNKNQEPRPCPFCNESYLEIHTEGESSMVNCKFCGAMGPPILAGVDEKKIWDQWNDQVGTKKMEKMLRDARRTVDISRKSGSRYFDYWKNEERAVRSLNKRLDILPEISDENKRLKEKIKNLITAMRKAESLIYDNSNFDDIQHAWTVLTDAIGEAEHA